MELLMARHVERESHTYTESSTTPRKITKKMHIQVGKSTHSNWDLLERPICQITSYFDINDVNT